MRTARRIVSAYFARSNASDIVEWTKNNQENAELLSLAHKLAIKINNLVEDG